MMPLAILLALPIPPPIDEKGDGEDPSPIQMSTAVLCVTVTGYGDYVALEGREIRRDEKLRLYYEVDGYAIGQEGGRYRIHLVQGAVIRRKGSTRAYFSKRNFAEYRYNKQEEPGPTYFENTFDLRKAPPGDYELEITLQDKLSPGVEGRQVVPFRITEEAAIPPEKPAESP